MRNPSQEKERLHHANWDLVTTPTNKGGLVLQKTNGNFFALLVCLNWRFLAKTME